MSITSNNYAIINKYISKYINDPIVKDMANYRQHGNISTLKHCINVAIVSFIIVTIFNININLDNLIQGAILHDFYLYDWHNGRKRPEGLHGFNHPKIAVKNAKRYFNINKQVENIIASHMFPLTITKIPKSKEAFIVSIADKICAIKESLKMDIYILA